MKKRRCINIDQCVVFPTITPLSWTVILLILFLFMLWAEGSKDMGAFWEARQSGWRLWFYLSGPISLAASVLVSVAFVLFPVSYVELGKESMRIHRAFKKDRIVRYDELFYVRLNPNRRKEWLKAHFLFEISTIEIRRKGHPMPNFWFSSSGRTYGAIAERFKNASSGKRELMEGDCFVADSQWVRENGSPQNLEWGVYDGRY